MGLDISKIKNADLKQLAYAKDANNDGYIGKEEIEIFKQEALKLGLKSKHFTQAMGLYKAGDAEDATKASSDVTTEFAEETPQEAKTRKDLRAERKGQKECKEQVKKSIKNAVGNAVKVNDVHKREVASLDNIVEALKIEYTQPYYAEIIKDVEAVVELVRGTEFDSKKDVNNIKKEIKKDLNDFQKSIVDDLIELAKEEQIQKETQNLRTLYDGVRKDNEGKAENFSNFLKETKTKAEQYNIKGSYSDEAFKRLENELRIETAQLQENKRAAMVKNNSENVTGRLVKKDLLDQTAEGDKITKQEIKKDKAGNKLTARKLDIDRTAEDLEKITTKELVDELGEELVNKLGNSYIPIRDENGKLLNDKEHNIRAISDTIAEAVGYDFWMNRDDKNHSEMEKITTKLETLLNVELTPAEVKKLMDLCHVKTEPKDRNFARALVNSVIPGLVGAAAGGALGSAEISQRVSINVPSDEANKILDQLKDFSGVTSTLNSDGTTTIRVLQSVEGCGPLLGALAGAGAGVAAGTIMSLIFGMENNEDSCFDTATKNITDIDEYAKHINNDQKDNPQKAELIIALAKAYEEAYGEKWSEEYHKDLEKFSGNVTLNCLEFRGGRLFAAKPEKPVEPVQPVVTEPKPVQKAVKSEVIVGEKTSITYKRKGGDSWSGLIFTYYPDVLENHSLKEAITALKKALGVDHKANDLPKEAELPAKLLDTDATNRPDEEQRGKYFELGNRTKPYNEAVATAQATKADDQYIAYEIGNQQNNNSTGTSEQDAVGKVLNKIRDTLEDGVTATVNVDYQNENDVKIEIKKDRED